MNLPVVYVAAACCLVLSIADSFGQDLKKGVTDLAHVDEDFHVQGEYSGNVTYGHRRYRTVGLQVVALGDGKFDGLWYQGGLPGNGHDGSLRPKLSGQRAGDKVTLTGEGWIVELQQGYMATVKNCAGGILGYLSPMKRHSPTVGATPPANAIFLFDGKDMDRLKSAKVTSEGLLQVGCETKEPVRNFTLHAEFRTPYMPYARGQSRGNSGLYLQKRYEVQILDSFGLELQNNDCAALYKFKAPDLNMSFPPLSWQTYDIDFTAPRFDGDGNRTAKGCITVRHNGVVVHNHLQLENKTGGGSSEGPHPLPILFQNHGNPVHFRNVWLINHNDTPPPCCGSTNPSCNTPEMQCRGVRSRRSR